MHVTEDTLGPWRVRAEWDDTVSRNCPVRVVVEADPNASPADLAGGISTTVLRRIKPRRPVARLADGSAVVQALRNLAKHRGVTDHYLAALAAVYADLTASGHRAVSAQLAEMVDRAPSTVKAQLGEARRKGLLSPAVPHRPGGELTQLGTRLLGESETPRALH